MKMPPMDMPSALLGHLRLGTVLALCLLAGASGPADARHHRGLPHQHPAAMAVRSTPMVVAAEPEAAEAGLKVLERGGTAVDAAVAIQATLSLVEPQSSGLGGGGFMTFYDAATHKITIFNGRETAPAAARPDRFLNGTRPWPPADLFTSGLATGVPGAMFMLEAAHHTYGKLDWSTLFDDPERLAREGFIVSRRLGYNLQMRDFAQKHTPDFQAYFSDGRGGLLKTGDRLKNPAYAATLQQIKREGMSAFRHGPLAESIISKVAQAPLPGDMRLSDLEAYRPEISEPLCISYRGYRLCGPPPPAGTVSVFEGLKILEAFPLKSWGVKNPRSWAALIEAERLAYADRDKYAADPDKVPVPTTGLIAAEYIRTRAASIVIGTPSKAPAAGSPPGAPRFVDSQTIEPGGTSHFVVIDAYGNALSMTTTVESYFGTGRMAGGFFLNNQLTDFSWTPTTGDGLKAANAVDANKRPRSAMSPLLIFDPKGHLSILIGSPGGPGIISYNIKAVIGMIDWGLSAQEAIDLPNVVARGDQIRVEAARMDLETLKGLKAMGYGLTEVSGEESGLNGLKRAANGAFEGGVDPRREGVSLSSKAKTYREGATLSGKSGTKRRARRR